MRIEISVAHLAAAIVTAIALGSVATLLVLSRLLTHLDRLAAYVDACHPPVVPTPVDDTIARPALIATLTVAALWAGLRDWTRAQFAVDRTPPVDPGEWPVDDARRLPTPTEAARWRAHTGAWPTITHADMTRPGWRPLLDPDVPELRPELIGAGR